MGSSTGASNEDSGGKDGTGPDDRAIGAYAPSPAVDDTGPVVSAGAEPLFWFDRHATFQLIRMRVTRATAEGDSTT